MRTTAVSLLNNSPATTLAINNSTKIAVQLRRFRLRFFGMACERVVDQPGDERIEIDTCGPGAVWQKRRAGHSRQRIDFKHEQLVVANHHVRAGRSLTPERQVSLQCGLLGLLEDV